MAPGCLTHLAPRYGLRDRPKTISPETPFFVDGPGSRLPPALAQCERRELQPVHPRNASAGEMAGQALTLATLRFNMENAPAYCRPQRSSFFESGRPRRGWSPAGTSELAPRSPPWPAEGHGPGLGSASVYLLPPDQFQAFERLSPICRAGQTQEQRPFVASGFATTTLNDIRGIFHRRATGPWQGKQQRAVALRGCGCSRGRCASTPETTWRAFSCPGGRMKGRK